MATKDITTMQLYSIEGKQVLHLPTISERDQITITPLASGVYIASFTTTDNTRISKKLIIR